jgi:hypothetical protein
MPEGSLRFAKPFGIISNGVRVAKSTLMNAVVFQNSTPDAVENELAQTKSV